MVTLEARRDHLRELSTRTTSVTEHEALLGELERVGVELRTARRERTTKQMFDRYLPTPIDDARATRITTLAHDTLTAQPAWVTDHIRHLHDNHRLNARDVGELATRITDAAAHLDLTGLLPDGWRAPLAVTVNRPQPP